jgi:hypothetical protein
MDMNITARAMLVSLKITAWSSSKLDKMATSEVLDNHGAADKSAGRFTKALVAKGAMSEIKKIGAEGRVLHYGLTLPWSQDGSRILPTKAFAKYDGELSQLKDKYEAAVRDFIAIYPQQVSEAKDRLGSLFNEADYPSIDEVESKFTWEYVYSPLPSSDDFRIQMSEEMSSAIKKQYEEHAQTQIKEANKHLWQRAYDVVSHMVTKLDEYGQPGREDADENDDGTKRKVRIKTFHESLVTNAREMAEALSTLNISQDPDLDKLAEEIKEQLTQYDAQDLKDDTLIRTRVASSAKKMVEEINTKLGGF